MLKSNKKNILLDIPLIFKKAGVKDASKVADLGCGSLGAFVFPASQIVGKRGVVYAVDILKTTIENIKRIAKQENLDNIKTIWSDLEIYGATKIDSATLDVAMLINTLNQSQKKLEIIRESVRMLKKGGRLLVVEWKNISLPFGPDKENRVDVDVLLDDLKHLNMSIEDEFNAGEYHYGIIAVKI